MLRSICVYFCALIVAIVSATTYAKEKDAVDLLLVLTIDTSGSLTPLERWQVQLRGYVSAFKNPEIIRATQSGHLKRIAVTVVQWAGKDEQRQVIPWSVINDTESSHAFSAKITQMRRQYSDGNTYLGDALAFSTKLIEEAPFVAPRKVIDISGDGRHRDSSIKEIGKGIPVPKARAEAIEKGITINGLPILGDEFQIDKYYKEEVIGGDGAFMIVVKDPDDYEKFADAIRRKLIIEISALSPLHK